MRSPPIQAILHQLRTRVGAPTLQDSSDRQLLKRFADGSDQEAFRLLVNRHGNLVLSTCRRVLRDSHDAEDAMQATFLVLARKAGSVPWQESIAGWLHQVAMRVSSECRRLRTRKKTREQSNTPLPEPAWTPEEAWPELAIILDQELSQLPAHYRAPLILCYLEGRTRDEAAEMLGWSLGTVKGRLERGRELLRKRLTRRGLILSAVLIPATFAASAQAALPSGWPIKIASWASQFRQGVFAPDLGCGPRELARGVLSAMTQARFKSVVVVLGLASLFGISAGILAQGAIPVADDPIQADAQDEPRPQAEKPEPAKGKDPDNLIAELTHNDVVRSVAFAPDGSFLASCGWDRVILIWDLVNNKPLKEIRTPGQNSAVAVSPDGKSLVVGCIDGSVGLWNVETGKETQRWSEVNGHVYAVAFAPDGKSVAAATQPGQVLLWKVGDKGSATKLSTHNGRVWSVCFSPDGRTVVSAGDDRVIRLWDSELNRERPALVGHEDPVGAAFVSPDGRRIVSGGWQGAIKVWEVLTGQVIAEWNANQDFVQWLSFAPGNQGFATAHRSGKVLLWDPADSPSPLELTVHKDASYCVTFSPKGNLVATSSKDGSVRVLTAPRPRTKPVQELTSEKLAHYWQALEGKSAAKAFEAIHQMSLDPERSIPFLAKQLKAEAAAAPATERTDAITRMIVDLDKEDYLTREKATEGLKQFGATIIPAVKKAMGDPKTTLEVRRRLERIVEAVAGLDGPPPLHVIRKLRAIEVLEAQDTAPSREVLELLCRNEEGSLVARDARAALARLNKNKPPR